MRDVIKHLELERIKFSLGKKKENTFYKIWQPFIDKFNDVKSADES